VRLMHLTAADYKRMPWKNGGGTTTEILVEPAGAAERYDWRISIADVAQSGPFSDFTGYDRTIMLIEGAGFVLDFDRGQTKRLDRPYEPFPFAGEWRTGCTLIDGPVRDFNLIAARKRPKAMLDVFHVDRGTAAVAVTPTTIIHILAGSAWALDRGLDVGDTLRLDEAEQAIGITAVDPFVAAVIRVGR